MSRLDETKDFIPVRIALLTVSDTRDLTQDRSGDVLAERIEAAGHVLADRMIVRDERDQIAAHLRDWIADPLVLDAAFQAMIVWAVETAGVPSLPTGLGRYEQFCERLPEGTLQLVIRVTETRDQAACADIDIRATTGEAAGRLLARITRYDCVMDSSLAGAFARRELVSEGSRRA